VLKSGSTSDAVLAYLKDRSPRYATHSQIVADLGRPAKAISWSLHYLRSIGLVEARNGHDRRSPLYCQYRYVDQDVD
jgi:hypothetical protein